MTPPFLDDRTTAPPFAHELRNQCDHLAENPGISMAFGDGDLGFPTHGPPPGGGGRVASPAASR